MDPGTGGQIFSSRGQLKERALASYTATDAGVLAPRVLILGEMPPETLVLASARPYGSTPDGKTSPDQLKNLCVALRTLHIAGVAHRDLRAANLLVGPKASGFISMAKAQTGASSLARQLDVAQILTTLAELVGAAEAVRAFRDGYGLEDEPAVAAILQPVALAPWGWSAMRSAKGCLAEVRKELAGPDDTSSSPIRLERFKWRTVLSAIALTVAAFLIVGQLSKVNLLGALKETNPGWFLLAVLAVRRHLPRRRIEPRSLRAQAALSAPRILGPAVDGVCRSGYATDRRPCRSQQPLPSTSGRELGCDRRCCCTLPNRQRRHHRAAVGHYRRPHWFGGEPIQIVPGTDVLIGLASIAVVIAILLAIGPTRAFFMVHIWRPVRTAAPRLLEAISQPLRMTVGVSANLLLTSSYVLALYAALLAVGAHPPLLATAAVFLTGKHRGLACTHAWRSRSGRDRDDGRPYSNRYSGR